MGISPQIFFNCYSAVPWPILGHYQGDSLTHLVLITAFLQFRLHGQREPPNEVYCKTSKLHISYPEFRNTTSEFRC